MNNKNRYTKNELTQLRLLFNQGKSDESIAAIMGRGIEGIKAKRRQLGLHRPDAAAISIKNGHKWTKDELEFIRNYWRTKTDEWMAKKLGVTVSSYKHKRQRMTTVSTLSGKPKNAGYIKRWTQAKRRHDTWTYTQEEFLREKYPNHSAKDIARYLGRSENAIQWKAKRMGLRKDYIAGRKGYQPVENYYSKETFKPQLIK